MEKCLVLGGGGFIGKSLCPELAKQYDVTVYDRVYCDDFKNDSHIKQVIGNFTQTLDFSDLLENVYIVYHLVGTTLPTEGVANIAEEAEENIIPTLRLLSQMTELNVKKIVFVSSGGTVYGERHGELCNEDDVLLPQCTYAVQKQVIENYLNFFDRCTSVNCYVARLTNPYGVGQNINRKQGVIPIFVYNLLKGLPIKVLGNGTDKRDYIHMSDVVNALISLGRYSGKRRVFNIGSGESYSLLEIMEMIERLTNKKFVEVERVSQRTIDVSNVSLNIALAKSELKWTPQKDLESGILELIDQYKKVL